MTQFRYTSRTIFFIMPFFIISLQLMQESSLNASDQNHIRSSLSQNKRSLCCSKPCVDQLFCGFMGAFSGALITVTVYSVILPKTNKPQESLTSCSVPTTLDPNTDMNNYCWSDCAKIGDNPMLCEQQAYGPVNATAGKLIQALQSRYGVPSQACLTTYDCSKIDNTPYNATTLESLLYGKASQRVQIQQNNNKNKVPKHQLRKR